MMKVLKLVSNVEFSFTLQNLSFCRTVFDQLTPLDFDLSVKKYVYSSFKVPPTQKAETHW